MSRLGYPQPQAPRDTPGAKEDDAREGGATPELRIEVVWDMPNRIREIWVERKGRTPAPVRRVLKKYLFRYHPLARAWIAVNFTTFEFAMFVRELAKCVENFEVKHQYAWR